MLRQIHFPSKSSGVVLKALGGTNIEHVGVAQIPKKAGCRSTTAKVYVAWKRTAPILCLKTCMDLGIIQSGENVQNAPMQKDTCEKTVYNPITQRSLETGFIDIFLCLGTYPEEYKIRLKNDAIPVINTPRRVPPKLYEPLRKTLADMEKRVS